MRTHWFAILACVAVAPLCRADSDLEAFERDAGRAKQLGATHIVITEDLPPALWEMDVPGDPLGADLNFKVLEAFQKAGPRNEVDLWTTLHALASQTAGKDTADDRWVRIRQAGGKSPLIFTCGDAAADRDPDLR